jgi:hypothetical protein
MVIDGSFFSSNARFLRLTLISRPRLEAFTTLRGPKGAVQIRIRRRKIFEMCVTIWFFSNP